MLSLCQSVNKNCLECRIINYFPKEATEGNNAKDMFGGRLTPDFVAEKLGHSNFVDVREMDLPNSGIRIVDLGAGEFFTNLRRYIEVQF